MSDIPDVEGQRSVGAFACRQSALSHRFGERLGLAELSAGVLSSRHS
jgi:hypothetical protein